MFEDLVNIYDDFTKNERTQSLARFASENEFLFSKREPFGEQMTVLRNFEIFKGKGVKRFIGIVKIPSREGIEAEIRFYDSLKTKDLETKSTSILELSVPNFIGESFRIKPKNAAAKIFSPSISKSPSARFKKRFKVEGNVEISSTIKILMLENPQLTVEGFRDTFLFYRRNKTIELNQILQFTDLAEEFVSHLESSYEDDFV